MKKFILILLLVSTTVLAQDKKVYVDNCENWYEIALGIALIKHDQEYNLYEALGFIDQYLTDSEIDNSRKRRLLQRAAEVWIENHEVGSDFIPNVHKKCDVK